MIISAIFASRLRSQLLVEALENWWSTTQGYEIETIVVIDDDLASCERLAREPRIDVLLHTTYRWGSVGCWNRGLALAKGDLFTVGSDDVRYEAGWLDKVLAAHQEKLSGYGMVGLNDGMMNGDVLSSIVLFDRQFCKDHLGGVMFTPHYRHLFADNEHNARAKRAGRFYWCAEAIARHLHPSVGLRPADQLDAYRDSIWGTDEATFKRREAAGFPDDFAPVIK